MSDEAQKTRHRRATKAEDALPMERLAFTVEQAVELSSLGMTSIYRAMRDGQLRCRKFGSRTIITRKDLSEFLENLPLREDGGPDRNAGARLPAKRKLPRSV